MPGFATHSDWPGRRTSFIVMLLLRSHPSHCESCAYMQDAFALRLVIQYENITVYFISGISYYWMRADGDTIWIVCGRVSTVRLCAWAPSRVVLSVLFRCVILETLLLHCKCYVLLLKYTKLSQIFRMTVGRVSNNIRYFSTFYWPHVLFNYSRSSSGETGYNSSDPIRVAKASTCFSINGHNWMLFHEIKSLALNLSLQTNQLIQNVSSINPMLSVWYHRNCNV